MAAGAASIWLLRAMRIAGGVVFVAIFVSVAMGTPGNGYRLIVDNALEDLAGNKIGQPFDIDVFDKVTEHITTTTTPLGFEIR